MGTKTTLLCVIILLRMAVPTWSADKSKPTVIGDFETGKDGWVFSLGKEFKGAEGNFGPDDSESKTGKQSAWMEGYFAKGGNYVGIAKSFKEPLNVKKVSFWLKTTDLQKIVFRITGSDHQTLQFALPVKQAADWQKITISDFTKRVSFWGGKADGKLHLPARQVAIILDKGKMVEEYGKRKKSGQLWLDGITVHTTPTGQ